MGADFRFVTSLHGKADGPVMATPLTLVGQGDPSLTRDHLQQFALAIKKKGIAEIPALVVDESHFDSKRWPPGFRHPSSSAYATPTGAVSLDGNTVEVVVTPGVEGQRAAVALLPPSDHLELAGSVTSGASTSVVVQATRVGDKLRVQVSGTVKAGGPPERRWARVLDPARYAGESFRRYLEGAGIKVGPLRLGSRSGGPELLRHQSKPLSELVTHMNRTSDNFYAEQILKALAARKSGPPGSTEKGIRIAEGLLGRSGIRRGTYRMENGSGLLGNQRFSPKQLVQLLERLHTLPWLFQAIRDSLAVAGQQGTMAKRLGSTAAAGRLRGKTGTLKGVSCLAGFVDGPPGRPPIVFAMLHNGFQGPQARSRTVQDQMAEAMARYMMGR
jgi:D-alanyl-D-alanine carboxypeptidase/D-alanyl-D-alanine-endopeptidase (penicillin-binding protein 4)